MKETILKKIKINRNKPKRKSVYTKANQSQYINDRHNKNHLNDKPNTNQLNDIHHRIQLNINYISYSNVKIYFYL